MQNTLQLSVEFQWRTLQSKVMANKMIRATLVKSKIGRLKTHKACLIGLGLGKLNQTVEVADTPENRGMINKVGYLLKVEEA